MADRSPTPAAPRPPPRQVFVRRRTEPPRRGVIAWMASNSVAANLLMLLFLVGGFLTIPHLRQEVFPEFDLDLVQVSIAYPGASPTEVEEGIVLAVEEAIRGLDGIQRVYSKSLEGVGTVTAELLGGYDGDKALQDVKSAVDRIESFPEEAERPIVSLLTARREELSVIVHGNVDERVLRAASERVRDELVQHPDITLVDLLGAPPLEISIEVPQEQLRAHGLTLEGIADVVRRSSLDLSGGGVKTSSGEILLRTTERRDYGNEFKDIPIVSRPDGTVLTLGDIAEIHDTFAETDQATYLDGEPAVNIVVYRVGDENPLDISKAAAEVAARLDKSLPEGIHATVFGDRSELYRDRLRLLLKNAYIGLGLVMIILGLFLDVRLAFWVMLGIPTSFLGCLLLLPHLGASINMITLFGFIIALGIVVDDAIVVGESIYYFRQRGRPHLDAAVAGARLLAVPVFLSILTNIAAVAPLLFVPTTIGKLWGNIPVILISVFTISLIEALFILPAHLAHQPRAGKGWFSTLFDPILHALSVPQEKFGRGLERFVETRYMRFIKGTLHYRYLAFSIAVALLLLAYGWARGEHIDFHPLPDVESNLIRGKAVLPYGTPFEQSKAVEARLLAALHRAIDAHGGDEITRAIMTRVGSGGRSGGPFGGALVSGSHLVEVNVLLVPKHEREVSAEDFTRAWREETGPVAGLESLSFQFTLGPGGNKPIDVQLSHPDPLTLEKVATRVAAALHEFRGVIEIDDGIAHGKPQLDLKVTPLARSRGVTPAVLARQVRSAFYGAEAARQQRGREEVKVMVRLPKDERISEFDIDNLVIATPQGGEIPFGDAARIKRGRAYDEIDREDGRRILDVTADVDQDVTTSSKVLHELGTTLLPTLQRHYPGLRYSFVGEQREFARSARSLLTGAAIAVLVIFALLAIPFRSYVQGLVVLTAVPFGFVGALVGHIVMGFDMSYVSIMGMVALAGVVVNDNLILVDTINRLRKDGESVENAAMLAPMRRFRPVVLTSLTTFFGLAPMIFETSVQARFMIPMAISLGFGILFSTLLALGLVPALFLITEDIRTLFTRALEGIHSMTGTGEASEE